MPSRGYWQHQTELAARRYGINPVYFERQINAESGFNPNAQSGAGAIGIAQIMPGTARGWGVNPHNPEASLNAAARAMSRYLHSYKGNWRLALAAYNAGSGAVAKYHGVPPYAETQAYVARILQGGNPHNQAPRGGGGGGGRRPSPTIRSSTQTPQLNLQPIQSTVQMPTIMPATAALQPLTPPTQPDYLSQPSTPNIGTAQGISAGSLLDNMQATRRRLLSMYG